MTMANYHAEAKIIQRSKGESVTDRAAYITASKFRDSYTGRTYDRRHHNGLVVTSGVILPPNAPLEFTNIQVLLDALNSTERRCDAQMARSYTLSLPFELPLEQQLELTQEFAKDSFIRSGQCAIFAIHQNQANVQGRSNDLPPVDKIRENPHVHLIVPFRAVGDAGFQPRKLSSRRTNNRNYLISLRKSWADIQNRAYERARLDIRVSHESLAAQGIKRQATRPLGAATLALERKGIQTERGNQHREIIQRNRNRSRSPARELERDFGPSR